MVHVPADIDKMLGAGLEEVVEDGEAGRLVDTVPGVAAAASTAVTGAGGEPAGRGLVAGATVDRGLIGEVPDGGRLVGSAIDALDGAAVAAREGALRPVCEALELGACPLPNKRFKILVVSSGYF